MANEAPPAARTIYALCEPDTGEVRYVGVTVVDPEHRLAQHVALAQSWETSKKSRWIYGLKQRKLRPTVLTLETVPLSEAKAAEARWMAHYRAQGANLTNMSVAGALGNRNDPVGMRRDGSTLMLDVAERSASIAFSRDGESVRICVRTKYVSRAWTIPLEELRAFVS